MEIALAEDFARCSLMRTFKLRDDSPTYWIPQLHWNCTATAIEKELQIITALTLHHPNLVAWQAECIAVWKQLVEAAAESNCKHPAQQATVKQQYLDLFAYLAGGAAEGMESVLTFWEMEYGKSDQKETIATREVLLAARLMQQEGHEDLALDIELYVMAGGGGLSTGC